MSETYDIKLPHHNWHRADEVQAWVRETFKPGTWTNSNPIVDPHTFQVHFLRYQFQQEEDAVMFRLKWL